MYNFWSKLQNYRAFRHLLVLVGTLVVQTSYGQSAPGNQFANRMPASYVPDDDVIVKPVDNELSFYQQYVAEDNSSDVVKLRNQIKVWNDNQVFANQYGMSTLSGSPYFVPDEEAKWQYFKDKYLRYLRRRGEQPFKDMPKNWYQEYRASNEVDTIDEMEARFKKSNQKKSMLPRAFQEKEISMWKNTKFVFQPRVDQGLVIVGFKSPWADARAWVGINGETEVNFQQNISSIGFRAMLNYYAHTGKYFTSFDQRIVENVYARYTTQKDPVLGTKDDTLMLLYARQF